MASVHVVGAVRIRIDGHARAKSLTNQRDETFRAAGKRVGVPAHPAADAELECPSSALRDDLLKIRHFLLGSIAPPLTGPVNRNLRSA